MINIERLESKHVADVAQLHISSLRTTFHGKAGQHLLTYYYRNLTEEEGGCGYVALQDGVVAGYVCGIWEPKLARAGMIRRYGLPLAWWGCVQMCASPEMLASFIKRLIDRDGSALPAEGYELRPIVVAPASRGKGIGDELVGALRKDARKRNFLSIHLYVETDNVAARRFYEKLAFVEKNPYQWDGRTYLRYELPAQGSE